MQLPSLTHRDVVPDHIDPIPFPEILEEARLLCGLMDMNLRLVMPRDSIEDSEEDDSDGRAHVDLHGSYTEQYSDCEAHSSMGSRHWMGARRSRLNEFIVSRRSFRAHLKIIS